MPELYTYNGTRGPFWRSLLKPFEFVGCKLDHKHSREKLLKACLQSLEHVTAGHAGL